MGAVLASAISESASNYFAHLDKSIPVYKKLIKSLIDELKDIKT